MATLNGTVVLVTGGSQGIGQAIAAALAEAGATVAAGSRRAPVAAPETPCPAGRVTPIALDVRDEASVRHAFGWLEGAAGQVDVLVNNAGLGLFKPLVDTTLAEWNDVLTTNLTGAFLCAREAFTRMAARGGGRIVNIGSVVDHHMLPMNGAYGASKMGLRALTEALNLEGAATGIRATLLSVGAVTTKIWDAHPQLSGAEGLTPADVARVVVDLVAQPAHVRMDEIRLMPPKGIL